MYYKEEWINGKLYWKASPNGEWIEFTKQQYAERLLKVESELKNLQLGAVMPSLPNGKRVLAALKELSDCFTDEERKTAFGNEA
jgi:hypothetical protein